MSSFTSSFSRSSSKEKKGKEREAPPSGEAILSVFFGGTASSFAELHSSRNIWKMGNWAQTLPFAARCANGRG
jgi:hypothetical protein